MKNKYFSFVALAAAALATSCASDDLAEQKQEQGDTRIVTLTASVNDVQTRVGMKKESSAKASFYWQNNDAILVQTVKDGTYSGAEFTTSAETGATSANFTGDVDSDSEVGGYAVYPYSTSHVFAETTLTYNLPDSYDSYTPAAKIFGKEGAYLSNPINMPMLGTIDNGKISFKCLSGMALIYIDKMPAASGTLTVSASESLAGSSSVSLGSSAEMTSSTISNGSSSVTFNFSGATASDVGVFYLPLPTGSYTNLTIKVTYGETTQTIPYGSLTVERAKVTAIPLSADSKGNLRHIVKNDDGTYTINGHEFVDLGLSVLWATMNIGANSATDYGNYYAWGEVTAYGENKDWGDYSAKTNYKWETYKFGTKSDLTKYNDSDGKTVLAPSDDAATVNWGSGVRMPTKEESEEIVNNCTWDASISDDQKTLYGMTVTGKGDYTSSSILLPPASAYNGSSVINDALGGSWWSSTLYSDEAECAYILYFIYGYGLPGVSPQDRYVGCSVRAVTEKP